MSLTEKDRKFQTKSGNSFPFSSGRPPGPTFAAAIAAALTRAYGGRHSAVKVVAGAVEPMNVRSEIGSKPKMAQVANISCA